MALRLRLFLLLHLAKSSKLELMEPVSMPAQELFFDGQPSETLDGVSNRLGSGFSLVPPNRLIAIKFSSLSLKDFEGNGSTSNSQMSRLILSETIDLKINEAEFLSG